MRRNRTFFTSRARARSQRQGRTRTLTQWSYATATGAAEGRRYSAHACLRICAEDERKIPAISAATARSGQAVEVAHTPRAAIITTTLPIASLREHSQTERTLASPFL